MTNNKTIRLRERLKALPNNPGVYLFKDNDGKVIYVGKAISLSNRIKSYFGSSENLSAKGCRLVSSINDFEFIITASEQEALVLECTLIKKHRPRYNINLKDDKTYPYLKITTNENWPGIYITRHLKNDGAKYFGPFPSVNSVHKTLSFLRKTFPFRSCTGTINGTKKQPCLNFHIHRCPGPCIGAVGPEEYRETLNQIILFLEGKQETVRRELNRKMEATSRQLQFEKAASLRDQIQAIEEVVARQKTATSLKGEQDVIALAKDNKQAYVEVFFIRGGKITGHSHFIMEGISDEKPEQVLTSFVKQYYSSAPHIPPTILLQYPVYETPILKQWLKKKRGGSVKLLTPQKGGKKQLIKTVEENAVKGLQLARANQRVGQDIIIVGLQELKEKLRLPRIPVRIECYDISCTQGTLPTGSMVVLEKGIPSLSQYRRFRIRSVNHIDDYAMIQEVLRRRFRKDMDKENNYRSVTPDLVLIDGGKGHLNAAFSVLRECGARTIPIASIAKQNEDVFVPDSAEPVDLAKDSSGQRILQRSRDEAHRFAISYHHNLRSRASTASSLDSISGIGPKRRTLLIKKFGSVRAIKETPEQELAEIPGISPLLAHKIKKLL